MVLDLLLVFDLDDTIVATTKFNKGHYDPSLNNNNDKTNDEKSIKKKIKKYLNDSLIEKVIVPAANLRHDKNKRVYICLLTNNSGSNYVSAVDSVLHNIVAEKHPGKEKGLYKTNPEDQQGLPEKEYFFDYIMMRQHKSRKNGDEYDPEKNLENIKYMLTKLNIDVSDNEIKEKTFFFDDNEHPELRRSLEENYLKITIPFIDNISHESKYNKLLSRLGNQSRGSLSGLFKGGSRPRRTRRINRTSKSRKRLRK